eukprot:m.78546 g.78546  ORF g.78546 m.78546 type:complete len:159 (-) comp14588_c0_seq4:67-543(-)
MVRVRMAARFVKNVCSEVVLGPPCMPNPPSHTQGRRWSSFTLREHLRCWSAGLQEYADSWRGFAEKRRADREEAERFLKAQREAISGIKEHGTAAKNEAVPLVRAAVQEWVAVYQATLTQFVAGYKEGMQEPPVPRPQQQQQESSAAEISNNQKKGPE